MKARLSRRALLGRTAALAGGLWLGAALPSPAARASAGPTRPVLLVHGFADQASTWRRAENALVTRLIQVGYGWDSARLMTYTYPERAGHPGWEDSTGDIAVAGITLAQRIRETAGRSADGQVDLLCFSMGGLVARIALNYLRDAYPGPRPMVHTAVMVATPNNRADVLLWLSSLDQRGQEALRELARDLMGLDLDTVAARQMQPGSPLLQRLNQPGFGDDRVRYAVIAGTATLQVQLWSLVSTFEIGDGLISASSAGCLPGLGVRAYVLSDQIHAYAGGVWQAVRQSPVIHGRLPSNDTVALAAAAELAPWSAPIRAELDTRLASGQIALVGPA